MPSCHGYIFGFRGYAMLAEGNSPWLPPPGFHGGDLIPYWDCDAPKAGVESAGVLVDVMPWGVTGQR